MSSDDDENDNIIKFEKTLKDGSLTDASMKVISSLTAREAKVLRERFGIHLNSDLTLEKLGEQFAVTRRRIREIEAKALKKLRDKQDDDPDDDGPDAA